MSLTHAGACLVPASKGLKFSSDDSALHFLIGVKNATSLTQFQ